MKPVREIKEYVSCPEIQLSDGLFPEEEEALLTSGARFVRVTQNRRMSALLKKYAGNRLHWLVCFPHLGGKDTTEGGYNEDYFPSTGMGVTQMAEPVDGIRS